MEQADVFTRQQDWQPEEAGTNQKRNSPLELTKPSPAGNLPQTASSRTVKEQLYIVFYPFVVTSHSSLGKGASS